MGQFWDSWVLWEKLCFVLACGIIVALFFGTLKLAYSHWRIRKYSRIAAEKQSNLPAPLLHPYSHQTGTDVPFGIRAIERGVEVEGVFISRSNTPASSARESRVSLRAEIPPVRDLTPTDTTNHIEPEVDRSEANHIPPMTWLNSDNSAAWASTFSFERASTPEHLLTPSISPTSSLDDLQPVSEDNVDERSGDLQKPPKILLVGSSDNALYHDARGKDRIHGLGIMQDRPGHDVDRIMGYGEASSTSPHSVESERLGHAAADREMSRGRQESRTGLASGDTRNISRVSTKSYASSTDFESMNAHRLSHAAETGQLTPRSQRIESSPGTTGQASFSSNEEPVDYFSTKPRQTSSDQIKKVKYEFASGFQFPSKIFDAHRSVSLPVAKSTAETFKDESTITKATGNSVQPASAHRHSIANPSLPHAEFEEQVVTRPKQASYLCGESQHTSSRAFAAKARQKVVHKVSSGFQVLKPGSFPDAQPSSLSTNKHSGSKLQKRNRALAESNFLTVLETPRLARQIDFTHRMLEEGRPSSEQDRKTPLEGTRGSREDRRISCESGEARRPERRLQKKRPLRKKSSFAEHLESIDR